MRPIMTEPGLHGSYLQIVGFATQQGSIGLPIEMANAFHLIKHQAHQISKSALVYGKAAHIVFSISSFAGRA